MVLAGRPAKRAKLLDDESSSSSEDERQSTNPATNGFAINAEYARRFEHNKKREEKDRLQEKYGSDDGSEEDESSTDESEDDDAEFATMDVDNEIMATLQAIKRKDPRVYDKDVKFYKDFDVAANPASSAKKEDKPMYLQDYHRQNLLAGTYADEDDASRLPVTTYQDEQDKVRRELVGSMHATAAAKGDESEGDSDDEDFLVAKSKPEHDAVPTTRTRKLTDNDIAEADKDPETYLSNFMAARAWLPKEGSRWQAFDSDDEDHDQMADDFEEAYNLRFEDPAKANEKLQSFARDVGIYSARRDEQSNRKRARERERERKDAAKQERRDERAQLRKLKIEEAQEKVNKIKEAAGMVGADVNLDDWRNVIEGDFDDDQWETEMRRRFGEDYYAGNEVGDLLEGEAEGEKKRSKPKKPKWDDDIDINDIVPDFDNESRRPEFALSSDDESDGADALEPDSGDAQSTERKKSKTKKDRAREKSDAKRVARQERLKIEEMVDSTLPLAHPALAPSTAASKAPVTGFRYRETSPTSFGLSARDILFAEDAQLNQFAGLKKLAAFRDEQKKRKDKKNLSKKARVRQWRKDVFGNSEAPTGGFERLLGRQSTGQSSVRPSKGQAEDGIVEGERKKRKRSRKGKTAVKQVASDS